VTACKLQIHVETAPFDSLMSCHISHGYKYRTVSAGISSQIKTDTLNGIPSQIKTGTTYVTELYRPNFGLYQNFIFSHTYRPTFFEGQCGIWSLQRSSTDHQRPPILAKT